MLPDSRVTHSIKAREMGDLDMEKQISVFILIFLLSSTLSIPNQGAPATGATLEELPDLSLIHI